MLDNVMLMSVAAGFCTTIGAMVLFMKRNWSKGSLAAFLGLAAGNGGRSNTDMMPSALLSNYKAATWEWFGPGGDLQRSLAGSKDASPKPCWGWVI